MIRLPAPAKINLALVVGTLRADGRHELVTVYQRIALCDRLAVERALSVRVEGFEGDTLVRRALETVADGKGFRAQITKRIPVAAGLGGGSSDAATALRLANALRARAGHPIEEGSHCSDGGWSFDGKTLRFAKPIPLPERRDTSMPLTLRVRE